MHKFVRYIFIVTVTILMVACNGEEEPLRCSPIVFSANEEMPARGTAYNQAWSEAEGSAFHVVAYYYAPGSLVAQPLLENNVTRNATVWGYSPVVYWPVEGTADFFSYAPACEGARKEFQRFTPNHTDYQAILADCYVPASQITTIHSLGTDNSAITAYPHDADNQYDLMMAYERDMPCSEQAVTSHVTMRFVHVMAGVKINMSKLIEDGAPKIPAGTTKIVIGLGRIRTGGTLAICEPATPGALPDVRWTLDGLEGTFYETYTVTWNDADPAQVTAINREGSGGDATFFFPPQKFESGLTVTAYFYNNENKRIDYRALTLPSSGSGAIDAFERGQILNLNIK